MLRSRAGLASLSRADSVTLQELDPRVSAITISPEPITSASANKAMPASSPTTPFARRRSSIMSHRRRDSTASHASIDKPPIESKASGAWFDVPIVLALVPAMGSFITGGEHVRDFLLLLLTLYFLHQLIRVPWELYITSRPHRQQQQPIADSNMEHAQTELHALALFYLSLTVASPLLGGWLLRTIGAALFGHEYISWFSTLIFVLAAGIRPWRHLITLLHARTLELQDIAHAGQPPSLGTSRDGKSVLERLEALEHQLSEALDDNDALTAETEDLKAALERAEEAADKAVRRAMRRAAADHAAQANRLEALEARIDAVAARSPVSLSMSQVPSLMPSILSNILGTSGATAKPAPTRASASQQTRRPTRLSRIPEEDEFKSSDVDAELESDEDEPEMYERFMEVAFAPLRSLRMLFFFIVRLVRNVLFTDAHETDSYLKSPVDSPTVTARD
ncbi:hypothetical protein BKA62DRAFT_686172 [Auriculariales sp. MPI-PUGE-AT-0066]|nr:hypothetical protein BKA62DRAFT_686172 [Auriculariales sp. MPI-PUGE-AT-0066]